MDKHASNFVRTRRHVSALAVSALRNVWALVNFVGSDLNRFMVSRDHILAVCVQTVEFNADSLMLSNIRLLTLGLSTAYGH